MRRYVANKRQRGFSLVAAIFVLVVFAMLGAFMLTISAIQHATLTYAVQGVRAYQAAASGIEWGVQRAIAAGGCPAVASFPVSNASGFTVSVQCSVTQHAEPGVFQVFVIAATATSGTFGTPDYFSRRLHATVTNAP